MHRTIRTERLLLRPSSAEDASRAFEIQSDWEVAKNLSMATYPPDFANTSSWFSDHDREREIGAAYRFAIDHSGRMIGLVDLDGVRDREATLGYWIERTAWGNGFAFEAAHAVVRFASGELKLKTLKAGHAADNVASGRVLLKLGFVLLDKVQRPSKPRQADVEQWRYVLSI